HDAFHHGRGRGLRHLGRTDGGRDRLRPHPAVAARAAAAARRDRGPAPRRLKFPVAPVPAGGELRAAASGTDMSANQDTTALRAATSGPAMCANPAPPACPARALAPVRPAERLFALDVVRGFAVLGILAVNAMTFAQAFSVVMNPTLQPGGLEADGILAWQAM